MPKKKAKDGTDRGRNGLFDEVTPEIIELHETTDLNVTQICKTVGIHIATYFKWKNKSDEFCKAIKEGEEIRRQMLKSLAQEETVKRVQGYTVEEEETILTPNDSGKGHIKSKKITKKHIKAGDTLLMYVNNNRDPEHWKHKEHIDHSGKIETGKGLSDMTIEELNAYIDAHEKAKSLTDEGDQEA